jgi:hypothetical protein
MFLLKNLKSGKFEDINNMISIKVILRILTNKKSKLLITIDLYN